MISSTRLNYYRRVFSAYFTGRKSHLTFWHTGPELNRDFRPGELGPYYMTFAGKADYPGQYDAAGLPMLDYHGAVGLQYNPIAISQYGLGNYNLLHRTGDSERRNKFLRAANWLVDNLERSPAGLWVWNHHFDWEYRALLKSPWYSALSQGQGLSLLVRAHLETGDERYREAARRALEPFTKSLDHGGVAYTDDRGNLWFEEYIVSPHPPTHVLNGFIWAIWGLYDFFLATGDRLANELFKASVHTLETNLRLYEIGFWSLYEQSGTRLKMIASVFYHHLHVVQLHVMHELTGKRVFREFARRWESWRQNPIYRTVAMGYKGLFKLLYY